MKFSFLTLFPDLIIPYFQASILKNAITKGLLEVNVTDIRDYSQNRYRKVDHSQIGGGAGQVLAPDTIKQAIKSIHGEKHIIFLTPCAKPFSHHDSIRLAKKKHIVLVCGRYEGFDERSIEMLADEVFSVGDFILTGGELPALSICDSISRHTKGVLGNPDSLVGESFEHHLLEAPIFSRSTKLGKKFENFIPPSEYSKGNHSKIADLKNNLAVLKTKFFRPDLYQKHKATIRISDEK